MENLDRQPPCDCCSTVRQHIEQHYDPAGNLRGDESPEECFQGYVMMDTGIDSDISVSDFAEYLEYKEKQR